MDKRAHLLTYLRQLKYRTLALTSGKYRGAWTLPDWKRRIYAHSILSRDGKLFFVKNSKAGCTTTAKLLFEYDFAFDYRGYIHHCEDLIQSLRNCERLEQALLERKCFVFSFVRHPVDRTVSAFRDFFLDRKNRDSPYHMKRIRTFGFQEGRQDVQNFDSFLDYIEADISRSPEHADRHWRPQHFNLAWDQMHYDYIGRIEFFQADLDAVAEMSGAKRLKTVAWTHQSRTHNRSRRGSALAQEISDWQKDRIRRLYETDFVLFGYE